MPGTRRLPRSRPETQGVAPSALLALLDALVEPGELHSLMVVRNGHVVAEGWAAPYSADRPHLLYSLSKSFTSTAVGFAQAEGLLDVDDLVLDHFADVAPADPGPHLRSMRLRHLLTMTTGHHEDTSDATFTSRHWSQTFLGLPVQHEPGTHFVYNTAATYMLAEAVQRAAGMRVLDYLTPRLLEPLGIEGATWEQSPDGVDVGGFGMSVTTEDIAVFGQLYLQDGRWGGVQLLPEGWAAEATRRQVPNGDDPDGDWAQGYGYQFWRGRHDSYRGDGAFGQYCVVLPALDVVVAITSASAEMHVELARVWEHLLPGVADGALEEDDASLRALTERLAALRLPVPVGAERGAPILGRQLVFEPNDLGIRTATLDGGADGDELVVEHERGRWRIAVGHGDLRSSWVQLGKHVDEEVLAAGAWVSPSVYELTARLIGGPHAVTLRAEVDGASVTVTGEVNVRFGDTAVGPLVASVTA
ncbi:serine hydrolase domain-containing protein [Cellulomonas edaphi]|uniref:Serine hydrolase n=1 Tax=Cellulomonas edaphi TaxID=3053468 RepID=A0ABT7S2H7_9CELL|nr:serine hydrolase [Cellulomons edaphi]MDM7829749.1 serine hydrolase [Cellulomons edaphi]